MRETYTAPQLCAGGRAREVPVRHRLNLARYSHWEEKMNRKRVLFAGLGLLLALGTAIRVRARPVEVLSRADLWKKADRVALATVESNRDEAVPAKAKPDAWVPVITRFHVDAILKGNPGRSQPKEAQSLNVRHYRYFGPEARITVVDGPAFVTFEPKRKNEYLVFLTAGQDGIYEPVTGQYDPWQSFLRVEPYTDGAERGN
jgi:hypothetical protein